MPGRTDGRAPSRRCCARWRCSPSSSWPGRSPARTATREAAADNSPAARIDKLIADPGTTTAELEVMRERLVVQRNEALAAQKELQPALDELNARINALGDRRRKA